MTDFVFTPTEFSINGKTWMKEEWNQYDILDQAKGTVLEIGFGMGYAHDKLHNNRNVTSIVVVELYQEVLDEYKTCNCPVIVADWQQAVVEQKFDTIFFDVAFEATSPQGRALAANYLNDGGILIAAANDNNNTYYHVFNKEDL